MGAIGGIACERAVGGEDRADDGDIREMGTAAGGVVGDEDIAGLRGEEGGGAADAFTEGSEVDGDVRGVDDETAGCVEDGAGVIEAFLDVGGDGGAAE